MSKYPHPPPLPPALRHREYERILYLLQIELVKLQRHEIAHGSGILVIFEGRDAAGKDGTIKHIVEHLSPRETRVVALGPPDDRDRRSWYFERYVPQLPAKGEMVLFNRSWYNRAGVERVMGFCTKEQTRLFLKDVPEFESLLVRSGIRLIKYYLDVSKKEQKRRLKERRNDPLKQWKLSPIDAKAPLLWEKYSKARDEMLAKSHTEFAPWTIVRADDKDLARVNVIRDLLWRLHYPGRGTTLKRPDPAVVFGYGPEAIESGLIAP
ncbi:MAG TPA: polyphosphate kinase 2 [Stellaceae bacterium]|nr:polyphosphate kinase 2 [Stellaceae bacterium]